VTTAPTNFFLTPPARLRRKLRGRQVSLLSRHGKYLIAELDDGSRLVLHLGMTGQIFGAGTHSPRLYRVADRASFPAGGVPAFRPDRHTHLLLEFADQGPSVMFRDPRRFGRVELLARGQPSARLERLGPDALAADATELHRRTRQRKVAVKSALLDQSLLAGVGNIYADEALFSARIRPTRAAGRVSRAAWQTLLAEVKTVLHRSIEVGGTTISDFVHPGGTEGAFVIELRVYGREGEPCTCCGTALRRRVVGGRSSHFCANCQR
jgi:formamidopyrimidine-DNA glycosylase